MRDRVFHRPRFCSLGGGGGGGGGGNSASDQAIVQQQAEEEKKKALVDRIYAAKTDPATQALWAKEEEDLANALRSQLGETQRKTYADQFKMLKQGFANTGNIASPAYATQEARLHEGNATVGTNIEDSVRRAILNLRTERERVLGNEAQAAMSGFGENAVAAATAGTQAAIKNAQAAQREDVIGNAFNDVVNLKNYSDAASRGDQVASITGRARSLLAPKSLTSSSGRVMPTTFTS